MTLLEDNLMIINPDTGEIYADRIPIGSKVVTPQETEQIVKKKQKEANNRVKQPWTFIIDSEFVDLKPATLFRLAFISTFENYNGYLVRSNYKRKLTKDDIAELLNISRRSFFLFWNEVYPKYIRMDQDGNLRLNQRIFWRKKMSRKRFIECNQLYHEYVRDLYQSVPINQHKQIGYILKMLPFINKHWNILCHPDDIYETELDDIRTISFLEFCDYIGYDRNNFRRLLKVYRSIKVRGKYGRYHEFVNAVGAYGADIEEAKVVINPLVLYNGSEYNSVQILEKFFDYVD